MSVLSKVRWAAFWAFVTALTPLHAQASVMMPDGVKANSHISQTTPPDALQDLQMVRVASFDAFTLTTTPKEQKARLPLAGWVLGTLLVGLAAADLRSLCKPRS